MEKCKHCEKQFRTKEQLNDHILNVHIEDNTRTSIEASADVCTELGVTQNEFEVVRDSLAPGANEAELLYFLAAAKSYDLNPIKKEIFFSKMGGKVTLMVSRDGYLKLAHQSPNFRGIHSGVVCTNDTFSLGTSTGDEGELVQEMTHTIPSFGDRGKILGAWCRIDVMGQSPIIMLVEDDDYNKGTPIWKQYGAAMIIKCVESIALKRICDSAGLVSVAEMVDGNTNSVIQDAMFEEVKND